MSNTALFIDLPNFFSRLLKSGIDEPRFLRDYFLNWLDFDLLASSLTNDYSGIWIFYSGDRIGPSSERIGDKYLSSYIRRINAQKGVTAHNVNIPGEQREPVSYKCEDCGHEGISEALSEKGIDSSLTVHLFDTMESWDTAFLLSGDADYVPVVASLRRKGKIVIGVGFSDASEALVRECYHYLDIMEIFLKQDILVYKFFKKDGIVQKWLCDEIKIDPSFAEMPKVELLFSFSGSGYPVNVDLNTTIFEYYGAHFGIEGTIDLTTCNNMITELEKNYKNQLEIEKNKNNKITGYSIDRIPYYGFRVMKTRIDPFIKSISGLTIYLNEENRFSCYITYSKNANTGKFEIEKKTNES